MTKRTLGMMIILFLLTFGIYPLYWVIKFQVELKRETNEGFGGLGHFLMLIFTFGVYAIYWQYAAGKRLAKLGATDQSTLYLIFAFVFPFINPFLMQDQANKLV
jgi:hypothetical protein